MQNNKTQSLLSEMFFKGFSDQDQQPVMDYVATNTTLFLLFPSWSLKSITLVNCALNRNLIAMNDN